MIFYIHKLYKTFITVIAYIITWHQHKFTEVKKKIVKKEYLRTPLLSPLQKASNYLGYTQIDKYRQAEAIT